jgi:hypothetical protein
MNIIRYSQICDRKSVVYYVWQEVGGLLCVSGRWPMGGRRSMVYCVLQVDGLWVVVGRCLLCVSGRWPMGGRRAMVYCVLQVGGLWVVVDRWFTVCFRSVA